MAIYHFMCGFPGGSDGTESACNMGRPGFDPWVGKIPWRRETTDSSILAWRIPWTVYSLCGRKESDTIKGLSLHFLSLGWVPGESHGQRSLAGYSPEGCKESDTTERLSTAHTHGHKNKSWRVHAVGPTASVQSPAPSSGALPLPAGS